MSATVDLGPKKQLRTGRSVWSAYRHGPLPARPPKEGLRANIVIVGAGISGAFMAYALSRHSNDIIVVDRRDPGSGSTHASTAMLQYEIDTPLTKLADMNGFENAKRAWLRSYRATQDLIRLVQRERIPCGLGLRSALYLSGDELGRRGMEQEARARKRAGLACEFLTAADLESRYQIERRAAIVSTGAAVADPVALSRALLRRALPHGVRLFTPVNVNHVLASRHGVIVDTGDQFIETKRLIFCTGYESVAGMPVEGNRITSSWAAATKAGATYPRWLDTTLVWEAAKPYLYLRTTPDRRLIVGGEDAGLDSPSYRADTLDRKAGRLKHKVQELLPHVQANWSHVWAGAFGESSDGLPTIGPVPGMPNCYGVRGFGGNGTIYSFIAAQMMPFFLRGRRPADADLFAFRD